jgi:hypothetical protein
MEQPDDELERWKLQWQALGGREDLARSLAQRVAIDGRKIRRELMLEVAAAAASTATCVWLLVDSRGKPVVVAACAGVLLFTGVWVTRLLSLKQASAGAEVSGLEAFLQLTRQRLVDEIKWQTFRRRSLNVMTLLVVPWTVWALFHRYPVYQSHPLQGTAELGLLLGILMALFIHLPRKIRSLEAGLQRFDALVDDRTLR